MNKEDLIKALLALEVDETSPGDQVECHVAADELLLEYINDKGVSDAFEAVDKWYS